MSTYWGHVCCWHLRLSFAPFSLSLGVWMSLARGCSSKQSLKSNHFSKLGLAHFLAHSLARWDKRKGEGGPERAGIAYYSFTYLNFGVWSTIILIGSKTYGVPAEWPPACKLPKASTPFYQGHLDQLPFFTNKGTDGLTRSLIKKTFFVYVGLRQFIMSFNDKHSLVSRPTGYGLNPLHKKTLCSKGFWFWATLGCCRANFLFFSRNSKKIRNLHFLLYRPHFSNYVD